jgi:hypothetical protein
LIGPKKYGRSLDVIDSDRGLEVENVSHVARYWNEASPEKAGVGGSIPSLATIYNQ